MTNYHTDPNEPMVSYALIGKSAGWIVEITNAVWNDEAHLYGDDVRNVAPANLDGWVILHGKGRKTVIDPTGQAVFYHNGAAWGVSRNPEHIIGLIFEGDPKGKVLPDEDRHSGPPLVCMDLDGSMTITGWVDEDSDR